MYEMINGITKEYSVVGAVVNPKLGKGSFVVAAENLDDRILESYACVYDDSVLSPKNGKKRYMLAPMCNMEFTRNSPENDTYFTGSDYTNYPRIHAEGTIPSQRGKGWGTAGYVGATVTATLFAYCLQSVIPDVLEVFGAGVSSDNGTRTPAASQWWNEAVKRKLAQRRFLQHGEPRRVSKVLYVDSVSYFAAKQCNLVAATFFCPEKDFQTSELEWPSDLQTLRTLENGATAYTLHKDVVLAADWTGTPEMPLRTLAAGLIAQGVSSEIVTAWYEQNLQPVKTNPPIFDVTAIRKRLGWDVWKDVS